MYKIKSLWNHFKIKAKEFYMLTFTKKHGVILKDFRFVYSDERKLLICKASNLKSPLKLPLPKVYARSIKKWFAGEKDCEIWWDKKGQMHFSKIYRLWG